MEPAYASRFRVGDQYCSVTRISRSYRRRWHGGSVRRGRRHPAGLERAAPCRKRPLDVRGIGTARGASYALRVAGTRRSPTALSSGSLFVETCRSVAWRGPSLAPSSPAAPRRRWIGFSIAGSMRGRPSVIPARPRKPGCRADQGSAKKPNFTFDSPSDSFETGVSLAAV
jgi:hypothetical protein